MKQGFKRVNRSFILICVSLFFAGLMNLVLPVESYAVPSFARQVQKPCSACHTIWPNLNQYGRQFKVKAYTDVSPKSKLVKKDNLNMLAVLPVSVRVFAYPYFSEDKDDETKDYTDIPHEVELFLAGRLTENLGLFSEIEWEPKDDVNAELGPVVLAYQYPMQDGTTLGLVLFRGSTFHADPFNSLGGRGHSLIYGGSTRRALTLKRGFEFAPFDNNQALLAHGYFLGNRLYAAIGAMRGEDTKADDPIDGYFRVAWDQPLSYGAVTFGGAVYTGKQEGATYESDVDRFYLDASLEAGIDDHLFEVQALYGTGEDDNVGGAGITKELDGFYLEGSYFFQRKMGVMAAYNAVNFDNDSKDEETIWVIGAKYLPWANVKLAIQYEDKKEKYVAAADKTEKVWRTVVDFTF